MGTVPNVAATADVTSSDSAGAGAKPECLYRYHHSLHLYGTDHLLSSAYQPDAVNPQGVVLTQLASLSIGRWGESLVSIFLCSLLRRPSPTTVISVKTALPILSNRPSWAIPPFAFQY